MIWRHWKTEQPLLIKCRVIVFDEKSTENIVVIFRNELPSLAHTHAHISPWKLHRKLSIMMKFMRLPGQEKGDGEWKSLGICHSVGFARHVNSIKLFFVATAVFTLHFNFLGFVGFCHFLYLRIASHHLLPRSAATILLCVHFPATAFSDALWKCNGVVCYGIPFCCTIPLASARISWWHNVCGMHAVRLI